MSGFRPVADVPGLPPGWSLGECCRRAPGFRPIAAGLVKIGLPPGNVGQRRAFLFYPARIRRAECAPHNPTFSILEFWFSVLHSLTAGSNGVSS